VKEAREKREAEAAAAAKEEPVSEEL